MENKENFEEERKSEEKETETLQTEKKPIYKKWWFWTIIAVVVLAIAIGSSGGRGTSDSPGDKNEGEGDLGDYSVSILDYRLAKDYEGKPVIIVKYSFTNNGDESESFLLAFDESAFQGGIGLNTCYFVEDSANYSADNQTKEIKPGASIDVEVAYVLNDSNTDVEIEVKELLSFSDKIIRKTFVIGSSSTNNSQQGNNVNDDSKSDTPECNLGDYYVEILGFRLAEDYAGDPVVIVKYKFTNNDENAAAFMWTLEDNVYQDGVGLNECYILDDDAEYSSDNQTKEIKKGSSIEVEVAYELNDSTTDIEVEVKEYISFRDEVVTKTFSIR